MKNLLIKIAEYFCRKAYKYTWNNLNQKQHNYTMTGIVVLACITFISGCYKEKTFPVKADFSIEVIGNKYAVPVKVNITNNTTGAETYTWILTGASPDASTNRDPGTLQYDAKGIYTIKLKAANQYGGMDSMDISIQIDAAIQIGFKLTNNQSYYPDAVVQTLNTTIGATSYNWQFMGGVPASSTNMQPGNVVFSQPGTHLITLTVGNGKETYTKDSTITVLPALVADFTIIWAPADNDMEVPFTAILQNNSISATKYNWVTNGANPGMATVEAPSLVYNTPGTYTVSLTAANDKRAVTVNKTITLFANSNLYQFTAVRLGINTAQNTIGCYFSAVMGKAIKSSEVTALNGSQIDIVYFGLNNAFIYNKFISPDSVQLYTFSAIPNAINTKIINRQENCTCTNLSAAEFDGMSTDAKLQSLNVDQTPAAFAQFDNNVLPRIVLFKTQDGRKGAIKIRQFVNEGAQSYVLCDIKLMKK